MKRRLLLVLLALIAVPVAVELVVQAAGDPRLAQVERNVSEGPGYWALSRAGLLELADEPLRFRMKPGFRATITGVEYRINELGLRGGAIEKAKPPGTRRVLVVGDSYAFGLGVSEEEALPRQLERRLAEAGAGAGEAAAPARVEVINLGTPAYQTAQELALLEQVGFALEPDVVVLLYYPNDNVEAALTFAPSLGMLYVDELPLPRAWKPVLARSYLYSLLARWDAGRRLERGEFDARGEKNWPITRSRLLAFAAACRERGVAFVFAPLPELSTRQELRDESSPVCRDHARVLALAAEQEWTTVDLRRTLLDGAKAVESLYLSIRPLDNHLNATGLALVAAALASY